MPDFRLTPPPRALPPMLSPAVGTFSTAYVAPPAAPSLPHILPPLPPTMRPYVIPYRQAGQQAIFSVASTPAAYSTLLLKATPLPPSTMAFVLPLLYFLRHYLMAVNDVPHIERPKVGGTAILIDGGIVRLIDNGTFPLLDGGIVRRLD